MEKHTRGRRSVAREEPLGTDMGLVRDAARAHESCLKEPQGPRGISETIVRSCLSISGIWWSKQILACTYRQSRTRSGTTGTGAAGSPELAHATECPSQSGKNAQILPLRPPGLHLRLAQGAAEVLPIEDSLFQRPHNCLRFLLQRVSRLGAILGRLPLFHKSGVALLKRAAARSDVARLH